MVQEPTFPETKNKTKKRPSELEIVQTHHFPTGERACLNINITFILLKFLYFIGSTNSHQAKFNAPKSFIFSFIWIAKQQLGIDIIPPDKYNP